MSEHLDLLQRAATRGTPRGIDRVVAEARRRLRRRRQHGITVVAALVLVGTGIMATGLPDGDSTTAVASSQDDEFVAVVPDLVRFELVSGTEPEGWGYESGLGNITIYQRLHDDGSVAVAAAIAVVDRTTQSTILDMPPLADGTAEGDNGTYPIGHDDWTTNGLVIVERTTPTHTIRVAGRYLDVPTTVDILESVELTAEGKIAKIKLPDQLPAVPTYDGPDISRMGKLPALSTGGHYRDQSTGQELTIVTARDASVLPAETLAWWYTDGTVLPANAPRTVVGEDRDFHVAHWRLDARSWVRVSSEAPLTTDLIRQLQTDSRAVDAPAWADLIEDRTLRTQTTGTTTTTTTTTTP